MTELEKIEYAKSFIDKLANGINPIDNCPVNENDIVNNVRLSRCFFYVSDILRQVIENGGTTPPPKKRARKAPFSLSPEAHSLLTVSQVAVPISSISQQLNCLIDRDTTKAISAKAITNWLCETGFLEIKTDSNGKSTKVPTEQGAFLGIYNESRTGQYGPYMINLYPPHAQQFIYDNIEVIIEFNNKASD